MPFSLKSMKSIDLSCASPASTAILELDPHSPTILSRAPRPLHRLQSYLSDQKHLRNAPCISELPFTPRPYYTRTENPRKSTASSTSQIHRDYNFTSRRKSSADVNDIYTPPGSARYLLSDSQQSNSDSDSFASVPSEPVIRRYDSLKLTSAALSHGRSLTSTPRHSRKDHDRRLGITDSPALQSSSKDQVVVLRVSLHCTGCEAKLRKHLSKMEGVKSFSIDLATKKVTVIGDVTPLNVLRSISKVKNAQFWPSPSSP